MIILPQPKFRRRHEPARRSSPPPVVKVFIQDVLAGDHAADWVFDSDVVSVVSISALKINGGSPVWLDFVEGNVLRVSYDFAVDVGQPWSCDGPGGSVVAVFANGGVLQAGSGETIEG